MADVRQRATKRPGERGQLLNVNFGDRGAEDSFAGVRGSMLSPKLSPDWLASNYRSVFQAVFWEGACPSHQLQTRCGIPLPEVIALPQFMKLPCA